MNKVITIGREFGSGGREIGKRLAEKLGYAYYDKEIIQEISKRTNLATEYVQQIVEQVVHIGEIGAAGGEHLQDLHEQGAHQGDQGDAGDETLQNVQDPAENMFHPVVPPGGFFDVGLDLGVVRTGCTVTHW